MTTEAITLEEVAVILKVSYGMLVNYRKHVAGFPEPLPTPIRRSYAYDRAVIEKFGEDTPNLADLLRVVPRERERKKALAAKGDNSKKVAQPEKLNAAKLF